MTRAQIEMSCKLFFPQFTIDKDTSDDYILLKDELGKAKLKISYHLSMTDLKDPSIRYKAKGRISFFQMLLDYINGEMSYCSPNYNTFYVKKKSKGSSETLYDVLNPKLKNF